MAETKYLNKIPIDYPIKNRLNMPEDYHCSCPYCNPDNFLGELFDISTGKYYSNRIRKGYYVDKAGDHLDVGQIIGYRWAIQNLMPTDGWLLDPTVGSGTAIVEAINNRRNAIGIELEYPEVAERNIKAQIKAKGKNSKQVCLFRQGNAYYIDEYLDEWGIEPGSLDMIINGTPYPKLSGKSSDAPERKKIGGEDKSFDYSHENNFGLTKGEKYWELITTMYKKSIKYLKPEGKFVIIIKDLVQNKKSYLLHKHIIDKVLETNLNMKYYGFFLHKHIPSTMFINTYNKRFPDVKIPLYQTGIVLKKEKVKSENLEIKPEHQNTPLKIKPLSIPIVKIDYLNFKYPKEDN